MISQLIDKAKWTKTNYISPHEYVLESDYPDLYKMMKLKIEKGGVNKPFRINETVKVYRYLDVDKYSYWTVENVLNRTTVKRSKLTASY